MKTFAEAALASGLCVGELPDGTPFSLQTSDVYNLPPVGFDDPTHNPDGTLKDPSIPGPAWPASRRPYMARVFGQGFADLPFGYRLRSGDGGGAEGIPSIKIWGPAHGMDAGYVMTAADAFLVATFKRLSDDIDKANGTDRSTPLTQAEEDVVAWRKLGGVQTGFQSAEAWAAAGRPTAPAPAHSEAAVDHQAVISASPPVVPPHVLAAPADIHAAANAAWGVDWPMMRPGMIAGSHGSVTIAPPVRQAILVTLYPRYIALAKAGLIGADGKLVG